MDSQLPSASLVDKIDGLARKYSLCRNRLWVSVQASDPDRREDMLRILSGVKVEQSGPHRGHEQCTYDFCEHSRLDFTSVPQRHECVDGKCDEPYMYDDAASGVLEEALEAGKLTAWNVCEEPGKVLAERPESYMAISHVWSDGTGSGGSGKDVSINKCLFDHWKKIAEKFQCGGLWWDTICMPKGKAARSKAILRMQSNYENANITLVHDLFIRSWEWINPEVACLAIILSPWFSRGWTALELACSRKVKVMFKGTIKDLDEDILAREDSGSPRHTAISQVIKALRMRNVESLNQLLTALNPRYTSWPRDVAIISGQLTGVKIKPKATQQDIYQSVLRKFGRISYENLFHDSVTMIDQFTWCPTNLFNMPLIPSLTNLFNTPLIPGPAALIVNENGTVVGQWDTFPANIPAEILGRCIWRGIHPLVEERVKASLKLPDDHVLLVKPGEETVSKALVGNILKQGNAGMVLAVSFVGPIYFYPPIPRIDFGHEVHIFDVRIVGTGKNKGVQPAESNLDFLTSSEFGYIKNIKALLSRNSDLANTTLDDDGNTALHLTAKNNHLKAVQLLQPFTTKNTLNNFGETPLSLAAQNGHGIIASELLRSGCDPNTQDCNTWTPLHHAVWQCHSYFPDVFYGLDFDKIPVDVNRQDRLGQAALHLAVERGNLHITQSLLQKGADICLKCNDLQTVLHRAAWGGSAAVLTELFKASPAGCQDMIDAVDTEGRTALNVAALTGNALVIKFLLRYGAMPGILDRMDQSPMHLVAKYGDTAAGADLVGCTPLELEDKQGLTPLLIAVKEGHSNFAEILLDSGANIESSGGSGRKPIMWAVQRGHADTVELLLRKGATVSAASVDDETPLLVAVEYGHTRIVEMLLRRENDLEFQFKEGRTALLWSIEKGHCGLVRMLLSLGADPETRNAENLTALMLAACKGDGAIVRILLQHPSVEIESTDKERGFTALSWAAYKDNVEAAEVLLMHGASLEHRDTQGETPIRIAYLNDAWNVVPLLSEHGARFTGSEGDTMLINATLKGYLREVEKLLDTCANLECRSEATPLGLAVRQRRSEMVDLLISRGANVDAKDDENATPITELLNEPDENFLYNQNFVQIAMALVRAGATLPSGEAGSKLLIFAIQAGDDRLSKLMIEKGVDLDYRFVVYGNSRAHAELRKTPLDYAAESGNIELFQRLRNHGASLTYWDPTGFHDGAWRCLDSYHSTATFVSLFHHGIKVPADSMITDELLGRAASEGNAELMQILRKGSVDPDHINIKESKTYAQLPVHLADILHRAVKSGSTPAVKELLDHGVDTEYANDIGRTAIFHAVGNPEALELLLNSGANPEVKDREGRTTLSIAIAKGHKEAVRILSEMKARSNNSENESKINKGEAASRITVPLTGQSESMSPMFPVTRAPHPREGKRIMILKERRVLLE